MNKTLVAKALSMFCLLAFCLHQSTQAGFCVAQKVIAEGGPYVCKSRSKIQKFRVQVSIPSEQVGNPLWITFYNGYGNRSGFSWVRVFLGEEVGGHILADERSLVQHRALSVNVSGRFSDKPKTLLIEGEGKRGAIFSWVLTSVKSDLSILSTTRLTQGSTCLIHGTGFSADSYLNKVFINGKQAQVLSSTNRIMKVKVPSKLKGKNARIQVITNGKKSNTLSVALSLAPPALISMSPYGGPVGGTLNIRGANFSRLASNNLVRIGPYVAPVIKVMDTGTLLCRIPNWGSSSGTLPVTVTVNGVPSRDHLNFWCVPHYYGGNPNAEIYQHD